MSVISRFIRTASPTVKALMGISIFTTGYLIHKNFIKPAIRRKKYKEAEEWANMIFEQEEKEDGGTTNLSH